MALGVDSGAGFLQASLDYIRAGGGVMPPLVACAGILWYAIGARWRLLKRGSRKNVRVLLKKYSEGRAKPPNGIIDQAIVRGLQIKSNRTEHLRRYLDEAFGDFESQVRAHSTTITVVVAISPLLGLLGTVSGMIETFSSLGGMSLYTQSGGIAAGIATALFTTQLGLVVAVPGVIVKSILDRRQHQIELDLSQIKDLLVSAPAEQH